MTRSRVCGVTLAVALAIAAAAARPASAAGANGQMTWAVHVSLAPTWFDPAETPGIITPFMVLYALHDALVKPMPGNAMAPSLAESWTVSRDGLTYEFMLRRGVKFHNGDVMTAEDVIPHAMDYFWQPRVYPYDPAKAKQLLSEAGYPNGFDAGELSGDMIYGTAIGEPVVNYLTAVGIRLKLRPLERAAFFKEYGEKKLKHVIQSGSAAPGNAATRLEAYAVTGGQYVYGSYPEVDGLYSEQANETNARARRQILDKLQQLIHERVMFTPVLEPAFLNGVGPRVEVDGLNAITSHAYSAPYEDLKLKGK